MSRFVTVKKNSSEYLKYIWGDFSSTERALPIESLNRGAEDDISKESITFEIKSVQEIKKPSFVTMLSRLIKWKYFFLVLVPIYYVMIKNFVYDRLFDPYSFILAAIGSLFLFAGLNIRNDVIDHISGFDRIIKSSSPKPILLGWITARKAKTLSWFFIFVSVLLAIPVCLRQPETIHVVGITFILLLIGNFLNKNNYKFNFFSEFILFLILGPALCSGYQVALGSGVDTEVLVFGSAWGVAVLFLLYVVQFANLFETSQSEIKNTLTLMGFDKSKLFLKSWWGFFLLLWVLYHYFYSSAYWLWCGSLALMFWSFPIFVEITHVHSPMSSGLQRVRKAGLRIIFLMITILILEQTWYLYNHVKWIS